MPRLSEIDQSQVEVVRTPDQDVQPKKLRISDLPPNDVVVMASPDEDGFGEKAAKMGLKAFAAVGRKLDSLTGAPTRAAIGAIQTGKNPVSAAWNQFNEPPELAPTGREIAKTAGFSEDETIKTSFKGIDQRNIRTSPAGIAGTAVDALADPTLLIPIGDVAKVARFGVEEGGKLTAKGAFKAAGKIGGKVLGEDLASTIRNKTLSMFSHVPEDKIAHYASRSAADIAKAPEAEAIKDNIDRWVGDINRSKEVAGQSLERSKGELARAYEQKLTELKGRSVPLAHADDVLSTLDNEKQVLGSLSEQADDALKRSNVAVRKKDLLDFMDGIGRSMGVGKKGALVGDEATAAASKLFAQRERIAGGFGNTISGEDLRGIMQQIRKDIKWNQAAGEFNDTLNGARKEFTSGMSRLLKDQSPEYSGYMKRMSEVSDSLSDMSQYFGTRERAISSLTAVADGKSPRSKIIEDVLRRHAEVSGNSSVLERVNELRTSRGLVDRSKVQDLAAYFFPEKSSEIARKQLVLGAADELTMPLDRLSQGRTQSIIKNQGGKTPNIEDRRALEQLGRMSGDDFVSQIKDRAAIDAFNTDATRGSRNAVIGGTTGAAIGGVVGGPTGASIGAAIGTAGGGYLDKNAPAIARRILDASKAPVLDTKAIQAAVDKIAKTDFSAGMLIRPRTKLELGLKSAQSTAPQTNEYEANRNAVRRRIERMAE